MKNMLKIKTPSNIYLWWNFGFSISMMMMMQIITGLMLSTNYITKTEMFESSMNIYFNMNYGWLMRLMHSNITSMLFILIIIHMTRSIMFKSTFLFKMWLTGMMMLIMLMMESFLGYSLIWNQMSYWAMMVITNFISAIPMLGNKMVLMIWGNFNINIILINRFLTMHFIMPIMIIILMLTHLITLHLNKSNNPMGIMNKTDLICLNPLLIYKDMMLIMIILMMLMNLNLINPMMMLNSDSFMKMNYFKTPSHIEPEWYFLLFYSMLRSINNKLSGLMIVMILLLMMMIMPILNINKIQSMDILNKFISMKLTMLIFFISLMSKNPVETPYLEMNKFMIMYIFTIFIMYKIKSKMTC